MKKTQYYSPLFVLEKIKFIPLFRKHIFIISLRKIFFELRITPIKRTFISFNSCLEKRSKYF